jgi:hypothetical protein
VVTGAVVRGGAETALAFTVLAGTGPAGLPFPAVAAVLAGAAPAPAAAAALAAEDVMGAFPSGTPVAVSACTVSACTVSACTVSACTGPDDAAGAVARGAGWPVVSGCGW